MGDSGLALWNDAKTNAEQTPAAGPIVEPSDTAQSTTTDSLATVIIIKRFLSVLTL